MRYLTVLAVSAAAILALAACGSSSPSTIPPLAPESQSGPTATSAPAQGDAVTGTVTWPDGHPAVGASVYFHNHDPGFIACGWPDGEYTVEPLPADGSYALGGCPCADLTAYIYLPSTPGADPANGGQDCWIIMKDGNGTYSGRQANPGDVINWQALSLPCSPTFYTSDPPTVQSQSTAFSTGSWQTAEQLTSGGGSGG